jgi:hypothetical protein
MTILQTPRVCSVFGTGEQPLREVDAGNVNVWVALGETAGVEAGATSYFEKVGFRTGPGAGPKGIGDCGSVIAEEVFTTECVKP